MYIYTHAMRYSFQCLCYEKHITGSVNVFDVVQYSSLYNAIVY